MPVNMVTVAALILVCDPATKACDPPFEYKAEIAHERLLNEDKTGLNCDAFAMEAFDVLKVKYPNKKIFLSECKLPDTVPLGPKEVPIEPMPESPVIPK